MDEAWKDIEHSLSCGAKAERLRERAGRLQRTSRRLRQQSAELVRYNRAVRHRRRKYIPGPQPFYVEDLRLPDIPID